MHIQRIDFPQWITHPRNQLVTMKMNEMVEENRLIKQAVIGTYE